MKTRNTSNSPKNLNSSNPDRNNPINMNTSIMEKLQPHNRRKSTNELQSKTEEN